MTEESLKNAINQHPLLALPPSERRKNTAAFHRFVELLMRQKKAAPERLAAQMDRASDRLLLDEDEQAAKKALFHSRTRTVCVDLYALMEAACDALDTFDAGVGVQFLTYFDRLYNQRMLRSAGEKQSISDGNLYTSGLSRTDRKLIVQLNRLLENSGCSIGDLSPRLYQVIAKEMDISEQRLRKLLENLYRARHVDSLITEGEDGEEENRALVDDTQTDAMGRMEQMEAVGVALEMLAGLEEKEYPRLFLTNDITHTIKEEPDSAVECARVLLRSEAILWEKIFVRGYLDFVLLPPPEPDSIRNLILARIHPDRPLQDRSIAAFKKVSASAVSQQRKRFFAQQKYYLQLYYALRGEAG